VDFKVVVLQRYFKKKSKAACWNLRWSQRCNKMYVNGSNCCCHISVLRFDTLVCIVAVIVCNDRLLRFCVRGEGPHNLACCKLASGPSGVHATGPEFRARGF
jgi:hypothetical protein